MIVYNTTFHIDCSVVEDCLLYLKKEYIPAASASGLLQTPALRRIMHEEEDSEGYSYSVQFHVEDTQVLNQWLEKEGNAMLKMLANRYEGKLAGFSTLLEEIDWENE